MVRSHSARPGEVHTLVAPTESLAFEGLCGPSPSLTSVLWQEEPNDDGFASPRRNRTRADAGGIFYRRGHFATVAQWQRHNVESVASVGSSPIVGTERRVIERLTRKGIASIGVGQ